MAKEIKNGRKRPANEPVEDEGNGGVAVDEVSPFRYYVKGERARADGAFLELLFTKILEEQGALPNFDDVWPRGAQALAGLNSLRLSQHSVSELKNVIGAVGGEFAARMGNRSEDLILWADAFWRIRQIYGSFRQYVRSFDTDGHEALINDLSQRLPNLSASMIVSFLRDAGEKIPLLPEIDPPPPAGERNVKQRPPVKQPRDNQGGGGRRRSSRGGNKPKAGNERPAETQHQPHAQSQQHQPQQQQQQQKPANANQEKTGSRSRRGRRGFFRRKRGARNKNEPAANA
jgi:hypothetical protein